MTDTEKIAYLINQFNELNDKVRNLSGTDSQGPVTSLSNHVTEFERDITSKVEALTKLLYIHTREGWFKRTARRWLEDKAERNYR